MYANLLRLRSSRAGEPSPKSQLRILKDPQERHRIVRDYIARSSPAEGPLQFLEAGCSRRWRCNLEGIPHVLTAVDLDKDALEVRKKDYNDLDVAICGDLRTVDLPDHYYDVIYTAHVLEHVTGVELVLQRFVSWLKPGGVIIIIIPDRDTVFGFVTRTTPFWFHILYHRYVKGRVDAGKPGHAPYPTVYEEIISGPNLCDFFRAHGLVVREAWGFGRMPASRHWLTRVIGALTLDRLRSDHINCLYVFERPAP